MAGIIMIDIFVGCGPNDTDLEQLMVLDYSLQKTSSIPYQIHLMRLSNDSNSFWSKDKWNTTKWATPFSGFRWGIPKFLNFEKPAIYCDADFIFLTDIKELVNQQFDANKVAMIGKESWRFCLTYWNNIDVLKTILNNFEEQIQDPLFHQKMMEYYQRNTNFIQRFNGNWNCVDGENLPIEQIDALHYSDMRTQFSHKYSIPRLKLENNNHWFDGDIIDHPRKDLQLLFDTLYQEALDNGFSLETYRNTETVTFQKESQRGYKTSHFRNLK